MNTMMMVMMMTKRSLISHRFQHSLIISTKPSTTQPPTSTSTSITSKYFPARFSFIKLKNSSLTSTRSNEILDDDADHHDELGDDSSSSTLSNLPRPRRFWKNKENQKKYMEWLGGVLKIKKMDDWYDVSVSSFRSNGGSGLLNLHRGSPSELVMSSFPEHDWKPWMFKNTFRGIWSSKENQRKYMKWLGGVLKIQKMDDWYGVSQESFKSNDGGRLLALHGNSPSELVISSFPEHDWKPWMFRAAPQGFWTKKENQRKYMEWLGGVLNFNDLDDWYAISVESFISNKGIGLISLYRGSPSEVVISVFSEHDWKQWMFKSIPQGFWLKKENQRKYMEWLGEVLDFKEMDDWYNVSEDSFRLNLGKEILSLYLFAPSKVVMTLFPEHDWKPWMFKVIPRGFWTKKENQKKYMEWLGGIINVNGIDEWYDVPPELFHNYYGKRLLDLFDGSVEDLVLSLFLSEQAKPTKAPTKLPKSFPKRFWVKRENQRKYMEWLGGVINVNGIDEWRRVPKKTFEENHGKLLMEMYGGSVDHLVSSIFPDEDSPSPSPSSPSSPSTNV